jgi:hypothetical protein
MTRKWTFEQWMQRVDAHVQNVLGLSVYDLPDCPFRDWYEYGMQPERAAKKAIRRIEGEDE